MENQNNLLDVVQAVERFPKPGEIGGRQGIVVKLRSGPITAAGATIIKRLEEEVAAEEVVFDSQEEDQLAIIIYIQGEQTKVLEQVLQVLMQNGEEGAPLPQGHEGTDIDDKD